MRRFICLLCLLTLAAPAAAQLGERPGGARDTSMGPKDLTGLSIKSPRVRIVHTTDPSLAGGSMHLQTFDPFLAWKMGKDLTQREFRPRDGVFAPGEGISNLKGLLTDGVTPAIVGNDQVSCGGCHNMPYRDAGAGTNFAKKSGLGRNATHFFGSGIQEMLAWQIRQKMMQQMDTNRDNWISKAEMNNNPILVAPAPGAPPIDYGISGDADGDGQPDLNNIFRVWLVDSDGKLVSENGSLNDPGVAGYNFILEVFGWGETRFNLNTTNRIFAWDPLVAHGGLEAYDPTTSFDPDNDGFSQISNAGFQQSPIGHKTPDAGNTLSPLGLSLDDPDGDGVINEISEGDLDMIEWYMLNSPRPGMGRQTAQTERGDLLFDQFGCNTCHVSEWYIEPADPTNPDIHKRYLGDLRFFDLDVQWNDDTQRMEGSLQRLYSIAADGSYVRNKDGFMVEGIGTDFKHHRMGPRLVDTQYDGTLAVAFRTGLLWGNGVTGFPWGHDGLSMTIDDIIRRHGGASRMSRNKYVRASAEDQEAVVAYMRIHMLYPTDQTPTDINGDGRISENYFVNGIDTGFERFNPEWLFDTPVQVEGYVLNPEGKIVHSNAAENVIEAYGLDLPYLQDGDLDGFADVQDDCPTITGYGNGCS